jgi:hypothetical protein
MEWFLVISLYGDPTLLVKPMQSKAECQKTIEKFNKKIKQKLTDNSLINSVSCEEGELMESYEVSQPIAEQLDDFM